MQGNFIKRVFVFQTPDLKAYRRSFLYDLGGW